MNSPTAEPLASRQSGQGLEVSNGRAWTIVWLLFTASLINYFDRTTLSFAIPIIAKDLSLGPEAKGLLLSAFFWSYALMQIPVGICADRMNLRWLYAGAFVLWSVAQGLSGFATTLFALICFRIMLGVGESIYLPGGTKIVSLLFAPSARGLACGIFDFGTRTGLFLEGILAPWLIKNYGWPTTFRVLGFTALLWLIPWFWATPRDFRDRNAPTRNVSWTNFFDHTADLLANRNLFGICLGFFFFDYYWYLLITWLPDYLYTVRKLSILKTGIYASMPFLVFGLSQPLGGWLGDRLVKSGYNEFKARKWIITVAFCSGLFLIPAVQVSNPNFAIALVMLGCFAGLSTPNMLVLLQHCAPPREAGLWTGIFNFVGNIAGILAPIVTGFLIEQTGSYTPPFMLAALAIAAGPLAFWFIVGPASDRKT